MLQFPMLKKIPIQINFLLPLSIVVLFFLVVSTMLTGVQHSKESSLSKLKDTVELASYISKVVHETQKERGFTSGLIAASGKKFEEELLKQRIETDKKIQILKVFSLKTEEKSIRESFRNALQGLEEIKEIRERVDTLSLSVLEAISLYSEINKKLLHVIARVPEISKIPKITQEILAYSNFLYAKENAGIERAIGTSILADDTFIKLQRVQFIKLVAMQELYLQNFLNYATDDEKRFYADTLQGDFIEISNSIRNKILLNVGEKFYVTPEYWLKNITLKIEKLKIVDSYLEDSIMMKISSELKNAYILYILYIFLNITSIILFIVMALIAIKIIKNEKKLKKLTDKYIINSITNTKGEITYVSEAFCNISGYTKEELIGKHHTLVRHPDTPSEVFAEMWSTIKAGHIWSGRIKNRTKDGGYYWVYANIEPLFNKRGEIDSFMAIRLDVTQSLSLEKQIADELEKSRQKDKMMLQQSKLAQMGEMISMIAHQWRQPLAAISSLGTAMNLKSKLGTLDNESVAELSLSITKHSKHLSETIDDFRDFFKPNKELSQTNFNEIIQNVLAIIKDSISTKNIKIREELECNESFHSFPNELKQVVLNLLKNAEDALIDNKIKDPCIKIKTFTEENSYILQVSDNAGGISEDIIEKIFDPYFSTKTKKDGTGLGLYMSKTIIEEHCKGRLHVSNDKEGAVFEIILRSDDV